MPTLSGVAVGKSAAASVAQSSIAKPIAANGLGNRLHGFIRCFLMTGGL